MYLLSSYFTAFTPFIYPAPRILITSPFYVKTKNKVAFLSFRWQIQTQ